MIDRFAHHRVLSLLVTALLALSLVVTGCDKKKSSSSDDDDDDDRSAQSDDDGKKDDGEQRAKALKLTEKAEGDKAKGSDDDLVKADAKKAEPDGARTFSGTWKTAWGPVTLVQVGNKVTGSYAGRFSGRIEGEYDGSSLRLAWIQTNGERGKAVFVLSPEGERFSGTWGSGASATNGGAWNGTRHGEKTVGKDAQSFSGTWKTAWGPVTLAQVGNKVTGRYAGRFTGKIEGEHDGSSLRLTWIQTNGERGKAVFVLSPGGDRFTGTWGSGASSTNGGAWNGTRTN
jgi:hypothetical protein